MLRRPTRADVLAVVAVAVGVPAAILLMVPRGRIRVDAGMAACQHNLHNLGLALAMSREDRNGAWPRYFEPDAECSGYCNAWGRLADGYLGDVDVFACPVAGSQVVRQDVTPDWYAAWCGGADDEDDCEDVLNAGYGWDNGRLAENCVPGRAVTADNLERVWMDGYGGALEGDPYAHPNHPDGGANVLFVDGAVFAVLPGLPHVLWQVEGRDVWRRGYMQNPRLDVGDDPALPAESDVLENGPGGWDDHDEIYAIDSDTQQNMFFLEASRRWETCGQISPGLVETRGRVADRADASIQPTRLWYHQTGWPRAAW